MSLFRVRDFWTFDLDQLPEHYESIASTISQGTDKDPATATTGRCTDQVVDPNGGAGSFVVSLGRFHSVGKHEVFVCASLNGFICVIQVPENKQPKSPTESSNDEPSSDNIAQRQLLCANQLGLPIADVKCGYFTSTLKQSIAVLSFDKLIVYQVKRRQVDLLTADQLCNSVPDSGDSKLLDESLFSHQLEEHHRIDLIECELASNIIILNNNPEPTNEVPDPSAKRDSAKTITSSSSSSSFTSSMRNRNKQSHSKQEQLPQRDLIVVQYHNQFSFTLIDHRKVVGNFSLVASEDSTLDSSNVQNSQSLSEGSHLDQLGEFMGPMPMVFMRNFKGLSALVFATSDNKIHCLQVAKLMALAKQSVMQRVVRDLVKHDDHRHSNEPPPTNTKQPLPASSTSTTSDNRNPFTGFDNNNKTTNSCQSVAKITIDLSTMVDWALELAIAPIQMHFIQRFLSRKTPLSTDQPPATNSTVYGFPSSQLLVMSRYYLDLYTCSGEHLWSQRFENPIICLVPYILPPLSSETEAGGSDGTPCQDRLLSLVCTDCLSFEKCNLLVVDEERIAWSALLNNRPIQLWRTNLSKISGAIVALDSNKGQLNISYLGTNLDSEERQFEMETIDEPDCELEQMDHLDKFPANLDGSEADRENPSKDSSDGRCKIDVDISLEAKNQWPDVQVGSCIKIRPEANSSVVLQNIVATMEFDDLIHFESAEFQIQTLSSSVVQVQLGSCWPDRREPISFTGRFFMHSTKLDDFNLIENENSTSSGPRTQQVPCDENLMPKSLKVKLYLRFNIQNSGPLLQEESFMLPLNMVAQLAHIDYSSGHDQTLDDVLANLNMYKRQPKCLFPSLGDAIQSPYYLCDIFMNSGSDLIEIVDDILESDLVCRGFNSEAKATSLLRPQDRKGRDMSTLENINLLAQSLDCRLKYRGLTHSSSTSCVIKQSSEEYLPAIMMSIALKAPSGSHIMQGLSNEGQMEVGERSDYAILWLHLCDLSSTTDNSTIVQEFIKLHNREWKAFEYEDKSSESFGDVYSASKHPILISIESDHPMPILFLQVHLLERLKRHASNQFGCKLNVNYLSESMQDAIEISHNKIYKLDNFMALSTNLYDRLKSCLADYDKNLLIKLRHLKDELAMEYCKFHISTMTSISLAKKLINLPDKMQEQFSNLSILTKQYHLNLIRILGELEKLKQVDYQYSKVPEFSFVEHKSGLDDAFLKWPNFVQIID